MERLKWSDGSSTHELQEAYGGLWLYQWYENGGDDENSELANLERVVNLLSVAFASKLHVYRSWWRQEGGEDVVDHTQLALILADKLEKQPKVK